MAKKDPENTSIGSGMQYASVLLQILRHVRCLHVLSSSTLKLAICISVAHQF